MSIDRIIKNVGEFEILVKEIKNDLVVILKEIITTGKCCTCRKNTTCSPHNNFKIIAIDCKKYIERKK